MEIQTDSVSVDTENQLDEPENACPHCGQSLANVRFIIYRNKKHYYRRIWKQSYDLNKSGLSWSAVGKEVGMAKSTVAHYAHYYVLLMKKEGGA